MQALLAQQRARQIRPYEQRVSLQQARLDAWNTLGSQLSNLVKASQALSGASSIWQGTALGGSGSTTIPGSVNSANPTVVGAQGVGSGQIAGTYDVEVQQLTQREIWQGDGSAFALPSGAIRATGAFYEGAGNVVEGNERLRTVRNSAGQTMGFTTATQLTVSWQVASGGVQSAVYTAGNNTVDDFAQWIAGQVGSGATGQVVNGEIQITTAPGTANALTSLTITAPSTGNRFNNSSMSSSTEITAASDGGSVADTLNITSGTGVFNINIASGSTLADIAQAINNTSAGVSASVSGNQLLLNATAMGSAGAFTISSSGTLAGQLGLTRVQAGQDTLFSIDGVSHSTTSSTDTSTIPGVQLTFAQTTTGPVTITVTEPTTTGPVTPSTSYEPAKQAIRDFVKAYNDTISLMQDMYGAARDFSNPGSAVDAPLARNTTLRSMLDSLRTWTMESVAGSSISQLGQIGISTGAYSSSFTASNISGHLTIDELQLGSALASNATGVQDLFTRVGSARSDMGVSSRINDLVNGWNAPSGMRASAELSAQGSHDRAQELLQRRSSRVDRQLVIEQSRIASYEDLIARLEAQSTPLRALFGLS